MCRLVIQPISDRASSRRSASRRDANHAIVVTCLHSRSVGMQQYTPTGIQDEGLTTSTDRHSAHDGGEIFQIDNNAHHTHDETFVISDGSIEQQCRTPTSGIAG